MPRTGRPTDDPKQYNEKVRMSESDMKKIKFCCEVLKLTKAEIMRQGVAKMYEEALKKK